MHKAHRPFLLAVAHTAALATASLLLLSGCKFGGMSGSGTESIDTTGGTDPTGNNGGTGTGGGLGTTVRPPPRTGNAVIATPSVDGTVSVAVGSNQTISVSFTSDDGRAVTGFALSDTTLPEGWSGPDAFTCTSAGSGNECVLNLTYAPSATESGTLTLNYIYVDSAGVRQTPGGSLSIPYVATAFNNVVASISPTGQINTRVGTGSQSVLVTFTTDDGDVATGLAVTSDLNALPANWSSPAPTLSCDIVSSGSGCQLLLNYAPQIAADGKLTLNFSYLDNAGVARSGALNIPYSTTSSSGVVATVSPTGQINAVQRGGGQAVTITFNTDDGNTATGLHVYSNLAAMPAGWSSASTRFNCGSVGTGNGCQLRLNYAPTALTSGTFTLNYLYDDQGGVFKTGSVNVAYAATTDNNVAGLASPSGQINAIVGTGSQLVTVTFTTDDGRPATALQVTTDLLALPVGWSSPQSTFTCSGVDVGSGCQMALAYAPVAAARGTLPLTYTYKNNAGLTKTGSVNIAYRATTDNNVVGTPGSPSLAVLTGSSTPVDIVFTTDDGNPAVDLVVTSGLDVLPADWSSNASALTCATVGSGTSCAVTLTYAPLTAATGTVTIGYQYTNNSGIAKTGTASIAYTAGP
jgi:hypothetical protein